jgi:hypothetical protein
VAVLAPMQAVAAVLVTVVVAVLQVLYEFGFKEKTWDVIDQTL